MSPILLTKSRWHSYSTFEAQILCRFSTVIIDSANIIVDRSDGRRSQGKSILNCKFCKKLKILDIKDGFWKHTLFVHDEIDISSRLGEIRLKGESWEIYWKVHSTGGKKEHITMKRLAQLKNPDFRWEDALAWFSS